MRIAGRILSRIVWAVIIAAARMIECDHLGHPGAQWRNGVRCCDCGRRWPA